MSHIPEQQMMDDYFRLLIKDGKIPYPDVIAPYIAKLRRYYPVEKELSAVVYECASNWLCESSLEYKQRFYAAIQKAGHKSKRTNVPSRYERYITTKLTVTVIVLVIMSIIYQLRK